MVELFHTIVTQTYRIVIDVVQSVCFEALSAGDTMMPKGGAPNNKQNEWTEDTTCIHSFSSALDGCTIDAIISSTGMR